MSKNYIPPITHIECECGFVIPKRADESEEDLDQRFDEHILTHFPPGSKINHEEIDNNLN